MTTVNSRNLALPAGFFIRQIIAPKERKGVAFARAPSHLPPVRRPKRTATSTTKSASSLNVCADLGRAAVLQPCGVRTPRFTSHEVVGGGHVAKANDADPVAH